VTENTAPALARQFCSIGVGDENVFGYFPPALSAITAERIAASSQTTRQLREAFLGMDNNEDTRSCEIRAVTTTPSYSGIRRSNEVKHLVVFIVIISWLVSLF